MTFDQYIFNDASCSGLGFRSLEGVENDAAGTMPASKATQIIATYLSHSEHL